MLRLALESAHICARICTRIDSMSFVGCQPLRVRTCIQTLPPIVMWPVRNWNFGLRTRTKGGSIGYSLGNFISM